MHIVKYSRNTGICPNLKIRPMPGHAVERAGLDPRQRAIVRVGHGNFKKQVVVYAE